ncbi:MAG: prepilin-type N-terminal cleavage/methylation domain-containing protein [Polaribacter sp.]|jgi:prepilin-type N-terminal cleavage/methylation domain-containing protein
MLNTTQKGFTLVEIAIVLVIVGLLIGGVLKGQEMVTNAKLKRIESDKAGIAAAMFSYQDRYLQLPGDDNAAADRFNVTPAVTNGNGDGIIGVGNDWAAGLETAYFWSHLRASGLVAGAASAATRPTNAFGGEVGVQDGFNTVAGHVVVFGQIEGPIARILEARLDDGVADTGRLQAETLTRTAGISVAASTTVPYVDTVRYNLGFRL